MTRIGPADELPPGRVTRVGKYAVGNNGAPFAVTRKCRHLGGNLDEGSIAPDGCLVCPWHEAKYDVGTGRMVRGPQGIFAKIPGLGSLFKSLTRLVPLRTTPVEVRGADLHLGDDA